MSRKKLAEKARGVSERTITRLENGEISSPRQVTIHRLAKALEIDPPVLTGDSPIPQELLRRPSASGKNQFNVRVNAAIRNAYELAALRYGVSTTKIAQLAPLLFVIAAEESLKYRREKLEEFQSVLDRRDELESALSYLPTQYSANSHELLLAEERSIEDRDLFGERLADICGSDWFEAFENPFEVYLRAQATAPLEEEVRQQFAAEVRAKVLALKPTATEADIAATIKKKADEEDGKKFLDKIRDRVIATGTGDASVKAIGPTSTEYKICRAAALSLVGSDVSAAELLLAGRVIIDKTFRGLKTPEECIAWIREHQDSEVEEFSEPDEERWPSHESAGLVLDIKI
jgi:transcriptional regulator with XRE-family HTH domain